MSRRIRPAALVAATLCLTLVVPAAAAPGHVDTRPEASYRTLVTGAARPDGPNPYLALLPDGVDPQYPQWNKYLRAKGLERAERLDDAAAGSPRTVTASESEPAGVLGLNDTPATSDPVAGFGTGAADGEALVTGSLSLSSGDATTVLPPAAEDDGDLTLATATGLALGEAVRYEGASIGDGPHGSSGSGTGDFDAYAIDAEAGDTIIVDIDAVVNGSSLDSYVFLYDSSGNVIAEADDDVDFDTLLSWTATADDTYTAVISGFYSWLEDPFDSSSGAGAVSEGPYDVTIARTERDIDVFAVDLRKGDVIGATVLDYAASVAVTAPNGTRLLVESTQDATFIYGAGSPLEGGGAHGAVVADRTGTHYVSVMGGVGDYTLRLQAFRPGNERFRTGRSQVLYLDFDGATVANADTLWGGFRNARLSPLSAFLSDVGLDATDEDAAIDAILASVRETMETDLRIAANGDFDASGVAGEFDVTILNSRDHADPFGNPNVSRVVVGGTMDELGIPTIGIAQSIDPGNFAPGETGVVLLDLLLGPVCDWGVELVCFADGSTDTVELVGTGVGNIVAHEAGHFLGSFHTEQFNATPSIMDQGGNIAGTVGVGDDGIFGTADDVDVDLVLDDFVQNEGFRGREDTRDITAFGLATGKDAVNDGPTANPDSFEFTGGPLVVEAPGVIANDSDPEFDALTTVLTSAPDTGDVDLGVTGGFTYTPATFGPTSFTYTADDGDAVSDPVTVDVLVRCGTAAGELRNRSFEIGMSQWCRQDGATDMPWRAVGDGEPALMDVYGTNFGFFLTTPTDGDLAAMVAWDGLAEDISLSQFVQVPPTSETAPFSFDWRAAWDLATYTCPDCGASDRELRARVSDALTGEVLDEILVTTAEVGTSVLDTGPQTATIDLQPYLGQFVRVDVLATVPDLFTGPGLLQVDNMVFSPELDETPVGVGDAYAVAVGGTLTVDAADGVLANDTDPEGRPVTAALVAGTANGALSFDEDGGFTYSHDGSSVLTDTFRYEVSDGRTTSAPVTAVIRIGDDGVVRLAGGDRIETAVAISQSTYPGPPEAVLRAVGDPLASAVVLARADAFADGLAGTPLAASVDGPMLLSFPDALPEATATEIERVLAPGGTVHLLGGEVALSKAVADAVTELGFVVDRIAGADRYATAVAVAERLGDVDTILVTRGDSFPDALAAGPAAITGNGAVVLTPADAPVDVTTGYLGDHPDAAVFAIGGPAARAYPDVTAIVGPTRHETAVLVANEFFTDPVTVGLARSDVFVDALAGGVHVGRAGGPILITPSDALHPAVFAWLDTQAADLRVAFAYGGEVALNQDVLDEVEARIR